MGALAGRKRGALVAALALLACLVAPGAAAAKSWTLKGGETDQLEARHGAYRIQLSAQENQYFLSVSKDHGDLSNTYLVKGEPSDKGLEADFGRFGRVDLEFHPVGPPEHEKSGFPGCHGKSPLKQKGIYLGTFRFRGDEGFVDFHAGRITGSSTTTYTQKCGGRAFEGGETEGEEATELSASTPTGHLTFSAISVPGLRGAPICLFFAGDIRRVRKVVEFRQADAFGHRRSFEFDEALTSASVRPGGAFEGSATFERSADGAVTWSGDLRAEFLGGSERLTGGRIEAGLQKQSASGASIVVTQAPRRLIGRRTLSAGLTRLRLPVGR